MAIAFRSASHTVSLTGTEPAGAAAGDVLIAVVASNPAPTGPTGWTQQGSALPSGGGYAASIWTITRGASAPSYVWGGGGSDPTCDIVAYSGASATIGAVASSANNSGVSPSVTSTVANSTLICAMQDGNAAAGTNSAPSGMTLRSPTSTSYIAELGLGAAGATGTKTWGGNLVSVGGSWSLILQPGPVITSISPSGGTTLGGTAVTVTGTGLTGTTTVTLDGVSATSVVVVSDTEVTCVSGAGTAGLGDVVAGGATLANAWTYFAVPTVTAISPAGGPIGGGTFVTITGTGFTANSAGTNTVQIGGVACTTVTAVSDTSITATAPAGTAGAKNVTVANANGTGTLTNGYAYFQTVDNSIKLVKGGTIGGTDHADGSTVWPASPTRVSYGGGTDLWGLTWTPADINSGTFGVAVSALVSSGHAQIDSIRATVYYSLPGVSDPAPLLVAMRIGSDGQTVTPEIYQLPRAGMAPGNDAQISHASAAGAQFNTSRFWQPSRAIQKTYRDVEWWQEQVPATNVPGVTVNAIMDDGSAVQLVDSSGNPATFMGTGQMIGYLPSTASGVGHYLQLQFIQPAPTGSLVAAATTIRDVLIHGTYDPLTTDLIKATLILGAGEFEDRQTMRRTARDQVAQLRALIDPQNNPTSYVDPDTGAAGFLKVISVETKELIFDGDEYPSFVAVLIARAMRYA